MKYMSFFLNTTILHLSLKKYIYIYIFLWVWSEIPTFKVLTVQNPETQNPEIQNPDRFKILTGTKSRQVKIPKYIFINNI